GSGRKEAGAGRWRRVLGPPADADEPFDARVIRREGGMVDRPVNAEPVAAGGLELIIAEGVGRAPTHQSPPADLPPADPIERFAFGGGVRIVDVVDEKMTGVFVAGVALRLNRLPLLEQLGLRDQIPVFEVVWEGQHPEIFRGIELAPGFEHDHAQAFLGQFFRGPPTGRARTDDYRVVNCLLQHRLSCFACEFWIKGDCAQTLLQMRYDVYGWLLKPLLSFVTK